MDPVRGTLTGGPTNVVPLAGSVSEDRSSDDVRHTTLERGVSSGPAYLPLCIIGKAELAVDSGVGDAAVNRPTSQGKIDNVEHIQAENKIDI